MTAPDVVVVGGGVIGLGIAWRAAASGLDVVVVDDAPGRGASWAAAGMLAPVSEAHAGEEGLLALGLASNERYPSFIAELEEVSGRDAGFRTCGTLVAARDRDHNAVLDELFSLHREHGMGAERLRARDCRRLEPGLSPRVSGGILVERDDQVDNRALVRALLEACERSGVELRRAKVAALRTSRDRVTGVALDDGSAIATERVVLCAGCWSGTIDGIPSEARPPVRPVKGQLLHLRGPEEPALVGRSIRGGDVYIVPRADGRIVVGATVEEQSFDTRVTAGAVLELLRQAYEVVPGIAELELTEIAVGLRPGSPDNAPLLGPAVLRGLTIATGHHRSGILLAPITADAIAELLLTGGVPDIIAPFSPARFAGRERMAG
ncbi:glycine oxidase ThiO [soil metagenome]